MANSISENRSVTYQAGDQEVRLSPGIVRKFLVAGSGPVTEKEIVQFMTLCKYQGLNPFLRDCYLVKYGSEQAAIITSKDFFLKRARSAQDLEGYRAGVIVSRDGQIEETEGLVPQGAELLGGWAEIYVKGWKFPVKIQVSFNEYVGRKRDGSPNQMWKTKPGTMIRKVALVQALRESFPGLYGGLYSPEEINTVDQSALDDKPVEITSGEVIDVAPAPQGEIPARRSRRNSMIVNGKKIKSCGVTGAVLEQLKALRSEHPDIVNPMINDGLDALSIQDTTFLREAEGQDLLQAVNKAVNTGSKNAQGQDKASNGGTQPGQAQAPSEGKTDNGDPYLWCPVREQKIAAAYCAARCDQKEKCEPFQEYQHNTREVTND